MKVSIITIAYNSADTIEDTIKSVLEQDYPNIEYIIVDGQSSDQTLEIIHKYQDRIASVLSESDKGIYDAMNKGVALSSGDIIGILNSDDIYASPTVVAQVVDHMEKTGAEGLYADLVYVDRERTDEIKRYWKSGTYSKGAFKKGWMPPHPTFFVKKSCYQYYGNYNTRLKTSADYELMLRFIHKHQIKLTYLPEVITKMRLGGQSNVSLRNRLNANKEDRLAWQINDLKPGAFTFIRKPLSKVGQFLKKGKN